LIEKQLALYIDTILTATATTYNNTNALDASVITTSPHSPNVSNVSYLFSPNTSGEKEQNGFSTTNGTVVDGYNSENKTFSWKQLNSFCLISALWLLQQTLSTSDLLIEHNVTSTSSRI